MHVGCTCTIVSACMQCCNGRLPQAQTRASGCRYIADRFLPDKAIDLIDEAAAKLKMEITSKPVALDELDRRVMQLDMERLSLAKAAKRDNSARTRLSNLDGELEDLRGRQKDLTEQWQREKDDMLKVSSIKEEVDRVNLEMQQARAPLPTNLRCCARTLSSLARVQLLACIPSLHIWQRSTAMHPEPLAHMHALQ